MTAADLSFDNGLLLYAPYDISAFIGGAIELP